MKRAAAVDPTDVDLLWEQAMMAKEFGEDEIVSDSVFKPTCQLTL
jgi:hypothetical protein